MNLAESYITNNGDEKELAVGLGERWTFRETSSMLWRKKYGKWDGERRGITE